ncbi:MAG: hypothetical protein JRG81_07730 [Deltaproteobacteria bacterium]|nr:hypothetical protein [Deltaproteobacteria bacterium]
MMDKIERVKLALEHKEPDRVPTISCMDVQNYVYEALGKPVPKDVTKYFKNPLVAKIVDVAAPLINKLGGIEKDVMRFCIKKVEADVMMGFDATWNVYAEIFRFKDATHFYDIWGRYYKAVYDRDDNLLTPGYIGGMFETPDDWRRWNKKEWQEHPEKMYNFNITINEFFGKDIYIFGSHLYGLFEQIWQPFGFRKFMQFVRKEKGFLEEIIEYNKNWYLKCVDASADAGFPAIIYSDDMAFKNGPMLNPKMMDQLLGAAFREITDHAHKKGVKIIIHTDGNTKPLLEYFIKWGFDGHHSIEPNADDVDLGEYKEIAGDRLSLLGHLDITHVLSFGSKEEVFKHVEESVKKAAKGGGLILGPCNSHYDIKIQNLRWMIEACGNMTYPMNV